ncbi:glycosyltransferase [Rickettsiaceae bacterium]|nr:glycosyltransferase [Rickettsiaceae bacterium]
MLKKTPLVSVPIITYNSADFIADAIDSVLVQDYPNVEIIICDDASSDDTLKIAQTYVLRYPNKIKLLVSKKNMGANLNWHKSASHCNGKYISGLAGDDTFLPNKISKQVSVMEADNDIAICYTDASVFHVLTQKELYLLSDKSPVLSGDVETALSDSLYYSPTIMFRKSYLPKRNLFSNIKHANDLAFFKEIMILSSPDGKIFFLPEVFYVYNKHNANLTVINNNNYIEHIESIKILQKAYPKYKSVLDPSIYDFCCVAFFKTLLDFNPKKSLYFFNKGLLASGYNPLKFLRSVIWGIRFYLKKWKKYII